MATLTLLNDKINSITTESEAKQLVKSWLPDHDLDHASFGLEAGVRNCSLIAEFVVVFVKAGVVNYASLLGSKPVTVRHPYKFPFTKEYRDVMVVESTGAAAHVMAIVREETRYALYHAWEGKFHVFPKLNPGKTSHNVFGSGGDVLDQINKQIMVDLGTPNLDVRIA